MKDNCSKYLGVVTSAGASDEHPMSTRSASDGRRWHSRGMQLICTLVLLFTFAIGNVWAQTSWVRLDSIDFTNTTTWSAQTISGTNSANTKTTVNGVFFNAKKAKSIKINNSTPGVDFDGQNGDASNHIFGIPVSGVNGSLKVIVYHDYNTTSASFKVGISHADGNDPSKSQTWDQSISNSGTKNKNEFILSKSGLTGANYIVWACEAGTSYKVIKRIAIYTEAPSTSAPAITAPTTDQSATYTVGDVITPLSVTATGSPTPTYQWYSNASASTTGATLITGAESASYTPSNAEASDLYYYCVATNSEGSAQSPYFHVEVNAAVATAPSFTSPASEPAVAEYSIGDAISALEVVAAGYPAPTLQWYSNSSKSTEGATLITGAESASYTPSNAAVSDLYFYCVATNASGTAQSEYFHVTVAAVSYCVELYPATSGASPTQKNEELLLQTEAPNASYGGKIYTAGAKSDDYAASFTYTANGLQLNKGGADSARVELNHLMQVGTVITATLVNPDAGKARGYKLLNMSKTVKATWQATTTDPQVYTYTVVAGDGLAGTNMFLLNRAESSALKELKVSNCGAELHALTSAIDPVAADGKATITLSKSLVAEGATATATYSDIDAAYDFDEWVISGATIDDAKANPVTITMGSTDAVITLKLKEAGVKYAVHFDSKGGSAVADQLVDKDGHASVPTAPTKFKYTFGGWSETDGGSTPADLASIAITAEKTFYAIWTPKVCPTSGTIYSFVSDGTKAPGSNTYCPASGVQGVVDIAAYATVSGGLAQGVHTTTSNNPIQIQTSTSAVKLSHADGYFRALLECPLQEGDTIKFGKTNKVKMAFDSLRTKVVEIASGTGANKDYYVVPSTYAGVDTIMVYYGGSSVNMTSLQVIRPEKFDVTFNLHGHGTPIAPQSVLDGGKVTEPADPSESGWDFDGWYAIYVADPESYDDEWDFDNDVVSAATELHAKWTEHVLSNNVALGTLQVNDEGVAIVPSQTVYNIELPFGTTAIPEVYAAAEDANAKSCATTQATAVDGYATIYIKAEDNITEETYTINFSVADHKDLQLVFKTGTTPCVGSASTSTQILSNNAAVSTYINQITFTNVEGAGDNGAEGGSLNVGKKAGNMFTLSAKPGFAFQAMNFLAKIQDANCEYSIDGSDWTELASTNTGGDECYAPFTSGTVHEFRLRSTGAEGVWIRNMQLTIIEACTPVAIAWDEEPVEFEVGKSGYAIAATANNGGTVSYSSESAAVVDVVAATGALTISGLGSATLKAATAEGDGTTYCANGGENIEISKVVNTYYLVKFDGQNGEAADEVKYYSGDAAIALPAAPTYPGFDFQGWFDAETGGNQYMAAITPAASMTVYAQWQAQCPGATITTQPVGASYLTGRTPAALVCEATAGQAGALSYEWFTCEDALKTNPVAATATPSTAVAGTFYYFCKVMEEGCDVEAFSDVVTITVTDKDPICLIATTVTGATAHGDVTGFLGADRGGDAEVNVSGGSYKMDKGKYIGVTLPDGYKFQEGDKVVLNVMTVNNATGFALFDGKEGSHNLIIDTRDGNLVEAGANTVVLPAYAGSQSVYVMREDNSTTGNLNSALDALAVYRTSAPFVHKVTVAGVDGTPDNTNHVAIEVPFSTTDDALDAIVYDWVSNNAAWDADPVNAPVATNAWEWGVENTVTFADKDGDESVYYITISKAAPSADASLSTLTVNGQAIALADGVYEYSFELPYGASVVPTVVATPNHVAAVATVDPCTLSGATITVVPESGAGDQKVYTLTFTISAWKEVAIWDGSTMSAVKAVETEDIASWELHDFGSVANYATTCGEKSYTKVLPSGGAATGRYMTLTVPAGYVAKFYVVMASHSDGSERGMFIGSNLVKDPDATSVLALSTSSRTVAVAGMSEVVGAGTWYINPNASIDFQEIRVYLRKGMVRNSMLGDGVLGTSCVDHNVAIEDIQGATFYELMGRDYSNSGKLAFDEIVSGELEAGVPYVFQAHGDKLVLFYGEDVEAAPVDKHNGMYGTFEQIELTELDDVYYFAQRALWSCYGAETLTIPANRAYVKLSEIGEVPSANPAPGRRRITMTVNGEKVATDINNLNASEAPVKMIINGQMYILRGEKMFDATGRLVK